ncbi:MAG: hypothetical protein HS116_21575 [Planctomycetes bacterium]|nr:hypothetical protein [Planctomycetota bacterium]
MRWSLDLASPAVFASSGDAPLLPESLASTAALALGPDAAGRRAQVGLRCGAEGMELAVLAHGPASLRPPFPEWYLRDHAVFFLDPAHDHATRWMYAVDDTGAVHAAAEWIAPGEAPGDKPSKKLPDPPPAQGSFKRLPDGGWWASLRLPPSAWSASARPVGFAVKAGFHEEVVPDPLTWPAMPAWAADTPLAFGDLHLQSAPLVLERLEIPEPAWDRPCVLALSGRKPGTAPSGGFIRAKLVLPGDSEQTLEPVHWHAAGDGWRAEYPAAFPARAKWSNDLLLTARLELRIEDEAGTPLWSGAYPFGFDLGIIARERFGRAGRARLPERPSKDDAAYIEKMRAYLLARLPAYEHRTTRDGAPSDFWLADPEGEAHLDLMREDAFDRVADLLAERLPDWREALAAAALWIFHPCVTRHSASWSRVSSQSEVRTVVRLAGCFCSDTSRIGACLAERIGTRLGVPIKGYTLGLRGHLATLLDSPDGRIVIDGMMGHWYPTLDHTRLATLEEMRADARIVSRVWYCPRAHGHEFYFGIDNQVIRPWREGALAWPAEGPPR